jgi:hypothetical protein
MQRWLGNQGVQQLLASVQTKLRIGSPSDPAEREADHLADQLTRIGGPVVQRKCACSSGEPCDECKKKKDHTEELQRKPASVSPVPPVVDDVRARLGPGEPLPESTRADFEARLETDLSAVRIHRSGEAPALVGALNALAFTVGNDIAFAERQYAPDSPQGRHLLAHEVAHTIQQSAGTVIRRKVSKDFARIRDRLTYGLFDWAITDADAHDVLMILKALNPTDLKDTVAAMEAEGFVNRLFSNVSDDDAAREDALLERINDVRVHKGKKGQPDVVGACDASHKKEIDDRVAGTKAWAKKAKEAAQAFAADPKKQAGTGKLLDTHFFHQQKNGPLTEADQKDKAQGIADNFEKVELQHDPYPTTCASPFDHSCTSGFLAYVDSKKKKVVFCESFFGDSAESQTYSLLHELTHEFAKVRDRGYGDERIFAYLSRDDAMNNADSYALFALDLAKVGETSTSIRFRATPVDDISDCTGPQKDDIRQRFAFASRMITNALNVIGDARIGKVQAETHFKTSDQAKLARFLKRFKDLGDKLKNSVNFECESKCGANDTGYRRTWGWTVHLCPAFFKLSPAEHREDSLLVLVMMERLSMNDGPVPGTPDYAKQTVDKAYDNPETFVAYARDITKKFFP